MLNQFEIGILDFLRENLSSKLLDFLMPIITSLGNGGIFWIALAVFFLLFKKTRKMGITMGVALIIGFVVCNLVLKNVVGRIRPYDFNEGIALLIKSPSDFSFPSGHTTASFEGAVSILLYNKKLGIVAVIIATLIAFSRLYLYVHYPTDVLFGALLGTGIAFLSSFFVKKAEERIKKN